MQEARLSVALVTRNRAASLERTLQSLRIQSVQPWEVVVSDDSDQEKTDAVRQIVATYQCQYIRGPRRGLYANRNHAALFCQGTHIRTMDDDHEFPSGHFEACLKALQTDPESVWIIGEYFSDQPERRLPPECPGQLHPRGFSVAPADPDACWAIADGATIYPRTVFDQGLRFDEGFPFGAPYLEFGSRLHWLGYRIRQLDTTYVIHHYEPSKRSFSNPENEMASQFFAVLCHSYIYQPRLKNKLLSASQIALEILRRGRVALRAFRTALIQYRQQVRLCASLAKKSFSSP
jgi:glycosyltransferase involved in cell wall biosynthesis